MSSISSSRINRKYCRSERPSCRIVRNPGSTPGLIRSGHKIVVWASIYPFPGIGWCPKKGSSGSANRIVEKHARGSCTPSHAHFPRSGRLFYLARKRFVRGKSVSDQVDKVGGGT